MFRRPTTIVVGAGCSREYGAPLGDGLRSDICKLLRGVKTDRHARTTFRTAPTGHDTVFASAVKAVAGRSEWQEWFRTCQSMAVGLQHASSIDRYLDIHRDNEVMVRIGKMAIGRLILKAENASSVMVEDGQPLDMSRVTKKAEGSTWLHQLFLRMQEGVQRDNFANALSNLTFVSFNYDRVIEHYLANALMSVAAATPAETSKMMAKLSVHYPYGRLGSLPWRPGGDEPLVPFGMKTDDPAVIEAIGQNLRIFTETVEENDDIRCIRHSVQESEQIIFLGFSYLQQNLDLLCPPAASRASALYGTVYGESGYNVRAAKASVSKMLNGAGATVHGGYVMETENATAGQFLSMAGNLLAS